MSTATTQQAVAVGSIFEMSWGYDQTNVDYYLVTSVTPSGKTVKLTRIGASRADGDSLVVPDPGKAYGPCAHCGAYITGPSSAPEHVSYRGEKVTDHAATPAVLTKRVQHYGDRPFLNMTSYANAYLSDGSASYVTPAGAGH